jgi:hypothetical protein
MPAKLATNPISAIFHDQQSEVLWSEEAEDIGQSRVGGRRIKEISSPLRCIRMKERGREGCTLSS